MSKQYLECDFYKVDVDVGTEIAQKCGVNCMPTFKLFINGENIKTIEGANMKMLNDTIIAYYSRVHSRMHAPCNK